MSSKFQSFLIDKFYGVYYHSCVAIKDRIERSLFTITILLLVLSSCQSKKKEINKVISTTLQETKFNGILYVKSEDDTLFYDSIHSGEKLLAIPGKGDKLYLASLSKLFTEISILKLKDAGLIDLENPISHYRKTFEPEFGNEVSILDLLKMRSGLPRELTVADLFNGVQYNEELLAGPFLDTIPNYNLSFEPGTREEYSNLNYWILGGVIESTTGKSLHSAFQELIFKNLNMINSGLFNTGAPPMTGYVFKNNNWFKDSTDYSTRYASGGCYSTMEDLIKLAGAIEDKRFLSEESNDILTSSSPLIEAFGSLPGFSNMFIQNLEAKYTIIVLNNLGLRDLSAMTKLKSDIERVLHAEQHKKSSKVVTLRPIDELNDSIFLERSFKTWINAIESKDASVIFQVIQNSSVNGSMTADDPIWEDLSKLNTVLPNFKTLGFRWVRDQKPQGLEVWFGSDKKGKLAIRWIQSENDTTLVENLFIQPDDIVWQGISY